MSGRRPLSRWWHVARGRLANPLPAASHVQRAARSLLLIGAATLLASAARADPRTDYMLNCRGCHGPDGRGIAEGAPSFRDFVAKFLWVPGGREYLVRVPGTAQSELTDARTAALLNWMVYEFSSNQVPADFAPYTEGEVARLRRMPLPDVVSARRALAEAIAARAAAPAAR